ncbi:hypothetical protein ES703_121997 [subsurface metagenome]
MPTPFAVNVEILRDNYDSALIRIQDAKTWVENAQAYRLDNNLPAAIESLEKCVKFICKAVSWMNCNDDWPVSPPFLPIILATCWEYENETMPEVTWQGICAAWANNNFEGKEWTVACIDRMRTLMWDEPFNIKWAASPTEQRE